MQNLSFEKLLEGKAFADILPGSGDSGGAPFRM